MSKYIRNFMNKLTIEKLIVGLSDKKIYISFSPRNISVVKINTSPKFSQIKTTKS